jgi:peroxiredoxin
MDSKSNMTRLVELEQKFLELEPQIPEGPEKQAISLLHAMIQEAGRRRVGGPTSGETTLEEVANLHKHAPPMEGRAENDPLREGTAAPDFVLLDAHANRIGLADFKGRPVVLVFYPLDWSPTCSDQLSLYQSELGEFERLDTELVGISVDSIYCHGAWAAVRGIKLPLLADFHPKGETARRYNVWRERDGFSERALYVVDHGGIIRYGHVSPELHKVPDIYELFEVLRGITKIKQQAV